MNDFEQRYEGGAESVARAASTRRNGGSSGGGGAGGGLPSTYHPSIPSATLLSPPAQSTTDQILVVRLVVSDSIENLLIRALRRKKYV